MVNFQSPCKWLSNVSKLNRCFGWIGALATVIEFNFTSHKPQILILIGMSQWWQVKALQSTLCAHVLQIDKLHSVSATTEPSIQWTTNNWILESTKKRENFWRKKTSILRLEFRARYPKTFLIENLIIHFKRKFGHVSALHCAQPSTRTHFTYTTRYAFVVQTRHSKSEAEPQKRSTGENCAPFVILYSSRWWWSDCPYALWLVAWVRGAWAHSVCRIKLVYKRDAPEQIMTLLIAYQTQAVANQRKFIFLQRQNGNKRKRTHATSRIILHEIWHWPIINSTRPFFHVERCWWRAKNLRRKSFK